MANRIIYGVGTNNVPYGTGYLAKTKEGITREYDPLHYMEAWLENKHIHIQSLAEKYRDVLDPRAYNALMNFKVGVVDEKGTVARLS